MDLFGARQHIDQYIERIKYFRCKITYLYFEIRIEIVALSIIIDYSCFRGMEHRVELVFIWNCINRDVIRNIMCNCFTDEITQSICHRLKYHIVVCSAHCNNFTSYTPISYQNHMKPMNLYVDCKGKKKNLFNSKLASTWISQYADGWSISFLLYLNFSKQFSAHSKFSAHFEIEMFFNRIDK